MEEPGPIALEADQVVKELSFGVESIEISSFLPQTKHVVYLNILTKENEAYCVELSTSGYRVAPQSLPVLHLPVDEELLVTGGRKGLRYQ